MPPVSYPGVFSPKTAPDAPHAGKLSVGEPPPSDIFIESKPTMHLRGIGFDTCVPLGPVRSLEAMSNAIRSRMLLIVPAPHKDCYRYIHDNLTNSSSVCSWFVTDYSHYHESYRYQGVTYKRYEDYWRTRYPKGVQIGLLNAEKTLLSRPPRAEDFVYSAFIKNEKFTHTTVDGVKSVDSRVVLSNTPISNFLIGPRTHYRSKQLYTKMRLFDEDGSARPMAWATHCSANDIGRWLQFTATNFPHPMWICSDQSRAERHFNWEALMLQIRMRRESGMDEENIGYYKQHLEKPKFRGQNNDLVGQSDKPIIPSGCSGTSQDNTTTNMCNTIATLKEPSLITYMTIGGGDDNALACSEGFTTFEILRDGHLRCGYTLTGFSTTDPWMIDFYSHWVCPSTLGWVLTPRLGRFLYRCGYTVNPEKFDVYSTMLGYVDAVSHCPFLREYVQHALTVTKKVHSRTEKIYITHEKGAMETPETWHFLAERYDLHPSDLVAFKVLLAECKTAPIIMHWPHLERILAIDGVTQ
jgi:hypothetical protein